MTETDSAGPSGPQERLAALGLTLPPVVAPLAAYVPAVRSGAMVYTAGQLPMVDGQLVSAGKVGAEVGAAEAAALARTCALNALARSPISRLLMSCVTSSSSSSTA